MLTKLTASELGAKLRSREVSAREAVQAHLDRIESLDNELGAFLKICETEALAAADKAQASIDAGSAGPLTGIPVAVKDNISTKGIETTCASKILSGYIPPYDATVVEKLNSAGAIIIGKTNLDEFAMGSTTQLSAYHPTKNPWDHARTPGGSSGGSAAAVCAELAPIALGSDTGGSIRQPAALCGVVGFKPTYGRVSRYGLVAFASSLDQIGPITRTVEDAALLANAISGNDPRESTSKAAEPIEISALKHGSLKGTRFAVPKEMMGEGMEQGVRDAINKSIETLCSLGATVEEISIPEIALGVATYYIIAPAEASSNLARFDGIRYGPRAEGDGHIDVVAQTRGQNFGHEVKMRIMIGTYALSAGYYDDFYIKATQVRNKMTQGFNDAYAKYDFILGPTSPCVAFRNDDPEMDQLRIKLMDFCPIPANMGGFPAISINCGLSEGLPVGLQIMAKAMDDEKLLQAAYHIEQGLNATVRPAIP